LQNRAINAEAEVSPYADKVVSQRRGVLKFRSRSRLSGSRSVLTRIIEVEAIPRIVLTQRASLCPAIRRDEGWSPNPRNVEEFASLALTHEVDVLCSYVGAMWGQGASLEQLYLELLAPAARQLENLGTADLFALTEATIGLGRLRRLIHQLNPAFESEGDCKWHGRHALIMPAPGEQHSFDLFIVGACLRRGGWEVLSWPLAPSSELFARVRSEPFALVWLSASRENRVGALAASIRRIRQVSQNPDIGIVVGGPLFINRPELVRLVGADAVAVDGRQATLQAQNLVDLLPSAASDQVRVRRLAEPVGERVHSKSERTAESVPA
jgi:MerR family transcriptional regulator, light-induced transcriptional regulator